MPALLLACSLAPQPRLCWAQCVGKLAPMSANISESLQPGTVFLARIVKCSTTAKLSWEFEKNRISRACMQYKVDTPQYNCSSGFQYIHAVSCMFKIKFEVKSGLDYDQKELQRCEGILKETIQGYGLPEFTVSIRLINEVYIQHSPF